jgi:hypothetical protein
MAQDKNMPPTEAPTPTPEAMPGEMAAPTQDMTAPADGQVMVQMPSDAFDSIYMLVSQLQSGLEALKADVDAQKSSSAGGGEMASEVPTSASDEEFLKSLAQEGSLR